MASYEDAEAWIEAQEWDFDDYVDFDDFIEDVKFKFNNNDNLINQLNLEPFFNDNKVFDNNEDSFIKQDNNIQYEFVLEDFKNWNYSEINQLSSQIDWLFR